MFLRIVSDCLEKIKVEIVGLTVDLESAGLLLFLDCVVRLTCS